MNDLVSNSQANEKDEVGNSWGFMSRGQISILDIINSFENNFDCRDLAPKLLKALAPLA